MTVTCQVIVTFSKNLNNIVFAGSLLILFSFICKVLITQKAKPLVQHEVLLTHF